MPRIAPIETAHADPGVKATLVGRRRPRSAWCRTSFRPSAQSPAVRQRRSRRLRRRSAKDGLTAAQREIISLAVAQANECQYCLSAHTLMGKGAGLSADGIRKAREGKAENAIDAAVASFARRVVDTRGQVTDADIAAARSAGLDDAPHHRGDRGTSRSTCLTNYTNNVALTDIDFPQVDVALRSAA